LQWPLVGEMFTLMSPKFMVAMNVRDVYADTDKIQATTLDRYFNLLRYPGNRAAVVEGLRTFANGEMALGNERLPELSMPTLIMWGIDDAWIPFDLAHQFQQRIANSQLILYPGVGHIPMEEIPERSVSDFLRFVAQHPFEREAEVEAEAKAEPVFISNP